MELLYFIVTSLDDVNTFPTKQINSVSRCAAFIGVAVLVIEQSFKEADWSRLADSTDFAFLHVPFKNIQVNSNMVWLNGEQVDLLKL